jgi:HK97 family phage prohead protease
MIKHLKARILKDTSLGTRQARIVISDATRDRVKDVMVPEGCDSSDYEKNPIVLAQHDPEHPIGNAVVETKVGRVVLLVNFAPEGISRKADEYCGLVKSGVIRAGSIGFEPIEFEPMPGGGCRYTKWKLMEASFVSVPANPNALVIQRRYRSGKDAFDDRFDALLNGEQMPFDDRFHANPRDEDDEAAPDMWNIDPDYSFDPDGATPDLGEGRLSEAPTDEVAYNDPDASASFRRMRLIKGLTKRFAKMGACRQKAADLHDDLHDQLVEWMSHGTSAGAHLKAMYLKNPNDAHLKAVLKCFVKMANCHQKAADLHDDVHDQLVEWAGHGTSAGEHLKSLISEENGWRPSTNIEDHRGDDVDQREPRDDMPDDTALDDDDDGEHKPNTFDDLRNDRDDDPEDLPTLRKPRIEDDDDDDDERGGDLELAYSPPQQKDGMPYRWDPNAGTACNILNDQRWEVRGRRLEDWVPLL